MYEVKLKPHTIELIKQIYQKYPNGGALHIVLDDSNVEDRDILWCLRNSIVEQEEDRELFEECAIDLMKLCSNKRRYCCIQEAFEQMKRT